MYNNERHPRPFIIGVFTSAAITKNCYDSWFQLGLQVSGVSYYYDILFFSLDYAPILVSYHGRRSLGRS